MRLGVFRFLKLFLTSFFIQSSWSFYSMQAMGFLTSIVSGTDKRRHPEIVASHKGFFNCHPYLASYIIGATVRAYDRNEKSEDIKKYVTIAQQTFASAGDYFFWQVVRPALFMAAVITGVKFGPAGPLACLLLYNVVHIYHRAQGIIDGYASGWNVIYRLRSKRFTVVQRMAESTGALLAGLLPWLLVRSYFSLIYVPLTAIFWILLIKRIPATIVVILAGLFLLVMLLSRLW